MSGSVGAGVSSDSWQSADWQRGRWGWQDWRGWGWQRTDWLDSSSWSQPGSTRPDYSDPPTWPGWAHRRLWVQAVKRWDKQTDVPTFRVEKLLRTFGWEMQIDFEHLSDDTLGIPDTWMPSLRSSTTKRACEKMTRSVVPTNRQSPTVSATEMRRWPSMLRDGCETFAQLPPSVW